LDVGFVKYEKLKCLSVLEEERVNVEKEETYILILNTPRFEMRGSSVDLLRQIVNADTYATLCHSCKWPAPHWLISAMATGRLGKVKLKLKRLGESHSEESLLFLGTGIDC